MTKKITEQLKRPQIIEKRESDSKTELRETCTVDGVSYSMPDSEFTCQSACRKRECEKSLRFTFRQF